MADALVRATAIRVSGAVQKARLVINQVRGLPVEKALQTLDFMPQAAAKPVAKLIRSAIANAEENLGMSRDELYVHTITADEGPTKFSRRYRYGARGRAKPIHRRSTHLTVLLASSEE